MYVLVEATFGQLKINSLQTVYDEKRD